ncbi:kelch repeat-containing protein [Prevotella sp. P6B4]|uniref:kelch repeat-containing protein n=1 Tax=Prevotella sp. P6B4 TaxID=1410614 RepID=UPI0018CC5F25|nr:kelch repeat-containing protein [Prevotella sp. P6B4]
MKKIVSLFAIIISLMACTKEEVREADQYSLPSVTMDSCVITSDNSLTAYMTVDKGESFRNHSLQMLVYDAKNLQQAQSTINVDLTGERVQKIQKAFSVPATGTEYLVSAVLKTTKNAFKSNPIMVSMGKMTAESYLRIWGQPRYLDEVTYEGRCTPAKFETDEVALHFSARRRFGIVVRAAVTGMPVEVRVGNRLYSINKQAWYYDSYWNPEADAPFEVNLDDDMEPGIYDVALHWGDIELPLPKKIRILPLKAEEEETISFTEFNDQPYNAKAAFRIADKMYYYTWADPCLLVSYDLNTQTWTKYKEVPENIKEMVAVGSKAYGITEEYTWLYEDKYLLENKLYEYDSLTDSWKKLSDVPTEKGVSQMKMFAAGGNVYLCGGNYLDQRYNTSDSRNINQRCMETWKYDVSTGQWTKVADKPTKQVVIQTGNGDTNGYVMTAEGNLWVYDSSRDTWTKETQLTSVYETINQAQCLLEYNGKLIYAGNNENSAIYNYDFNTGKWELLGLYETAILSPNILAGTFHNGKLVLGPVLKYADTPNATNMKFITFEMK